MNIFLATTSLLVLQHDAVGGDLISRIRSSISVTSSSDAIYKVPPNSWTASNIIDGIIGHPDTCACCAGTLREYQPWLQVELGKQYSVSSITIIGRPNASNKEQFSNIAVYAGNTNMTQRNQDVVMSGNPNNGSFTFYKHFSPPIIFQYLLIKKLDTEYLTICEVYMTEGECSFGKFGENCSKTCHCRTNTSCSKVNGHCQDGCAPGWLGDACDQACTKGHFGFACNGTCHCKEDDCNKGTGHCASGCATGWQGEACDKACRKGHFGLGCNGTCHCKDDVDCNKETGHCEPGCAPGWQGDSCNKDATLNLRNEFVITNMSSTYASWNSSLAIDGNKGPDPKTCECCARTHYAALSWWSVDLGRQYPIGILTVYGRQLEASRGQELEGFQIILSNTSSFEGQPLFTESGTQPSTSYNTPAFNVLARFIRIQRLGILTICEVIVREGDCLAGHFGKDCSNVCNCLDGKACDRNTGKCQTPFCKLGWSGSACDRECEAGHFGENCSKNCYCASGEKCATDYGICPGNCVQGYRGPQCNIDDNTKQSLIFGMDATGIIVGSGVSAAIVVVLAVVGMFLWKRRRDRKCAKENDYSRPENSQMEPTEHDYDTLDNINDVQDTDVCYQNITGL